MATPKIYSNFYSNWCACYNRASVFAVVLLLFVLICIPNTFAIGVAPGDKSFVYSGEKISYDLRIVNDEQLDATYDVSVNGELAKYISLSTNSLVFKSGEGEKYVTVTVSFPLNEEISPDEYVNRIVIRQRNVQEEGVIAFVGVISKLTLVVPGDSAYIKSSISAPNFINGTSNSFLVDVVNKGSKTADGCIAVIDILSSTNSKVGSVISNEFSVVGTSAQKISLAWTPKVNNGKYIARASVVCSKTSSNDEKIFNVGSPQITVGGVNSEEFRLGEINKLNLILSSEWGEQIDNVYADIELLKGDVSIFSSKTESANFMSLEKKVIPIYLDTRGLEVGKYELNIMLHYLGKDEGQIFSLTIESEAIKIENKMSGLVTGGNSNVPESEGGINSLLIISIIIIIIINAMLVMKLVKNKKNKGN